MTWIVGMPFFFGYGLMVSDVRVSWNGREEDCLQKVFPVARFVGVGFAGSVYAGFVMLNELRREYSLADKGDAWIPQFVADDWRRRARTIYARIKNDPRVQGHPCHLLFVGAHPTEHMGNSDWPRCYAWKMRSPDFELEFAEMNRAVSVGSGTEVSHYREALADLHDDDAVSPLIQMEVGGVGGFASAVQHVLGQTVAEHPVSGVSKHLHLAIVTRGMDFRVQPNDHTIYPGGSQVIQVKMPHVARSWEEFEEYCRSQGLAAGDAIC